jgi:hypothetical protein
MGTYVKASCFIDDSIEGYEIVIAYAGPVACFAGAIGLGSGSVVVMDSLDVSGFVGHVVKDYHINFFQWGQLASKV